MFKVSNSARTVVSILTAGLLTAARAAPAGAAVVSGLGTWATTLLGRDLDGDLTNGFEAYYDTVLDITWLADAHYALTSGYAGTNI